MLKRAARWVMLQRFGGRGDLRPPLGPPPSWAVSRSYWLLCWARWRWCRVWYRPLRWVYHWTGLPQEWVRWYGAQISLQEEDIKAMSEALKNTPKPNQRLKGAFAMQRETIKESER